MRYHSHSIGGCQNLCWDCMAGNFTTPTSSHPPARLAALQIIHSLPKVLLTYTQQSQPRPQHNWNFSWSRNKTPMTSSTNCAHTCKHRDFPTSHYACFRVTSPHILHCNIPLSRPSTSVAPAYTNAHLTSCHSPQEAILWTPWVRRSICRSYLILHPC